jgi:hypothetical protein
MDKAVTGPNRTLSRSALGRPYLSDRLARIVAERRGALVGCINGKLSPSSWCATTFCTRSAFIGCRVLSLGAAVLAVGWAPPLGMPVRQYSRDRRVLAAGRRREHLTATVTGLKPEFAYVFSVDAVRQATWQNTARTATVARSEAVRTL